MIFHRWIKMQIHLFLGCSLDSAPNLHPRSPLNSIRCVCLWGGGVSVFTWAKVQLVKISHSEHVSSSCSPWMFSDLAFRVVFQMSVRNSEYPPILQSHSRTLAVPYKELRFHRNPCDSIGNNYRPKAQHLKIEHLHRKSHWQTPRILKLKDYLKCVKSTFTLVSKCTKSQNICSKLKIVGFTTVCVESYWHSNTDRWQQTQTLSMCPTLTFCQCTVMSLVWGGASGDYLQPERKGKCDVSCTHSRARTQTHTNKYLSMYPYLCITSYSRDIVHRFSDISKRPPLSPCQQLDIMRHQEGLQNKGEPTERELEVSVSSTHPSPIRPSKLI